MSKVPRYSHQNDELSIVESTESTYKRLAASKHKNKKTARLLKKVGLLIDMIRNPDFHLSVSTKLSIFTALLYFVMPADLTPDFIPIIGYVDDAAVLSALFKKIRGEIDRFEIMLSEHKSKND